MKRVVVLLAIAMFVAKAVAAARLGLFPDEAFYWQCAQRLDWAYADHPFMTALLVRAGTTVFGDTTFGVRSLFLALGALVPWLVWLLARPLVGARDGIAAVGVGLITLGLTFHGTLAIPDTPLQLFTLATLVCAQRAVRTAATRNWVCAGLFGALALSTHLRAVLVPAALALFLLFTQRGRALLRTRGPWLGLLALLPGLLPEVIHNVQLHWAPLLYQGEGRHSGGFAWSGLFEHLAGQLGIASGLLWFAFVGAFVRAARLARGGDAGAALCVAFATAHIGPFLLLSPITDRDHTTLLWTAAGFLPLLPYVVPALRAFAAAGANAWRRVVAIAPIACAAFAVVFVLFELATKTFGIHALDAPFSGWKEIADATLAKLPPVGPGGPGARALVIADNYKLGAELEFYIHKTCDVFVLDHPKNREHGRQSQYVQWQLDEAGLAKRAGADALAVWQRSETKSADRKARRRLILSWFDHAEEIGETVLEVGDSRRQFKFFAGHGLLATPNAVPANDADDPANKDD